MADRFKEIVTTDGTNATWSITPYTGETAGTPAIQVNNAVTLSSLAGTGNRLVVADATGNLSASNLKTSFTPVIHSVLGNITSYTVVYCYVSKIGKLIKQTAYVNISNKGTASGDLLMSLYSTCASTGACTGQNATLGTGIGGICSAADACFRKMDGSTPIVENNFLLTAEYYEA